MKCRTGRESKDLKSLILSTFFSVEEFKFSLKFSTDVIYERREMVMCFNTN